MAAGHQRLGLRTFRRKLKTGPVDQSCTAILVWDPAVWNPLAPRSKGQTSPYCPACTDGLVDLLSPQHGWITAAGLASTQQ